MLYTTPEKAIEATKRIISKNGAIVISSYYFTEVITYLKNKDALYHYLSMLARFVHTVFPPVLISQESAY